MMQTHSPNHRSEISSNASRGVALFLGGYTLLGLLARHGGDPFDANLWWVDLRLLPRWFANGALAVLGVSLSAFGLFPRSGRLRRRVSLAALWFFSAATLVNAIMFWRLLASGHIRSPNPIPNSLIFTGTLLWLSAHAGETRASARPRPRWILAAVLGCGMVFPVLQTLSFGKTDYSRPADVAVVFGARVYADGRLSDAVADRVRTACDLYRRGLVERLLMSGGPGDGPVHETEAMTGMALRLGVPPEAILVDTAGLSTAATVRNSTALFRNTRAQRVLAVSEFYHLPRIKLAYSGNEEEVYTVPARPGHWLRSWPLKSLVREVPAFWFYFLQTVRSRL